MLKAAIKSLMDSIARKLGSFSVIQKLYLRVEVKCVVVDTLKSRTSWRLKLYNCLIKRVIVFSVPSALKKIFSTCFFTVHSRWHVGTVCNSSYQILKIFQPSWKVSRLSWGYLFYRNHHHDVLGNLDDVKWYYSQKLGAFSSKMQSSFQEWVCSSYFKSKDTLSPLHCSMDRQLSVILAIFLLTFFGSWDCLS